MKTVFAILVFLVGCSGAERVPPTWIDAGPEGAGEGGATSAVTGGKSGRGGTNVGGKGGTTGGTIAGNQPVEEGGAGGSEDLPHAAGVGGEHTAGTPGVGGTNNIAGADGTSSGGRGGSAGSAGTTQGTGGSSIAGQGGSAGFGEGGFAGVGETGGSAGSDVGTECTPDDRNDPPTADFTFLQDHLNTTCAEQPAYDPAAFPSVILPNELTFMGGVGQHGGCNFLGYNQMVDDECTIGFSYKCCYAPTGSCFDDGATLTIDVLSMQEDTNMFTGTISVQDGCVAVYSFTAQR